MTDGFLDLQVNGYGGVDFNQHTITGEAVSSACEQLRQDGVSGILATIISERIDVMCDRLERLAALRDEDRSIAERIVGLHIEGPFLNESDGYRGAHLRDAVRVADVTSMQRLLDAGGGLVRIVTLAPERDPGFVVTKFLVDRGIVVAAGHCNPTLRELDSAIDAGLSMFTHLGNGCPMMMDRHDNIIQRALSRADRLWLTFIADGVHVPFPALGNYLRCAGVDRCIVVTDAIAPAGLGPGNYTLGRWQLEISEDLVARSPDGSHLIGSAVSMPRAAENLSLHVGLTGDDVRRLVVENPARAIG